MTAQPEAEGSWSLEGNAPEDSSQDFRLESADGKARNHVDLHAVRALSLLENPGGGALGSRRMRAHRPWVPGSFIKEAAGDFLAQGNHAGVGTRIGALLQSVK